MTSIIFKKCHLDNISHLDTDFWKSLHISKPGAVTLLKRIGAVQGIDSSQARGFLFTFSTCWQLRLFHRPSSLLCLDSTHKTCCVLKSDRRAFLHSIVIKHEDVGCRIPVAFMINSSETMVPLEIRLSWLKDAMPINQTPTLMIDCSRTELAAIKSVFPNANNFFCRWHFLGTISLQANSKIEISGDRKAVFYNSLALL